MATFRHTAVRWAAGPFAPLGLFSWCFWGWGGDSSSVSLGPTALMSLLEVNEEGPDFLGVHSDDGVSW